MHDDIRITLHTVLTMMLAILTVFYMVLMAHMAPGLSCALAGLCMLLALSTTLYCLIRL